MKVFKNLPALLLINKLNVRSGCRWCYSWGQSTTNNDKRMRGGSIHPRSTCERRRVCWSCKVSFVSRTQCRHSTLKNFKQIYMLCLIMIFIVYHFTSGFALNEIILNYIRLYGGITWILFPKCTCTLDFLSLFVTAVLVTVLKMKEEYFLKWNLYMTLNYPMNFNHVLAMAKLKNFIVGR